MIHIKQSNHFEQDIGELVSLPCFRIILESILRIGCGDRTFGVPFSCLPDISPIRPKEVEMIKLKHSFTE